MNKVVYDTSFISALYNELDSLHKRALKKIEEIDEHTKSIIPGVTILEINILLNRPVWQGILSIEEICNHMDKIVYTDKKFLDQFQKFVSRTNLNLKPNDYAILFTAVKYKALLLTFDRQLLKAYADLQGEELFSK